MKSKYPSNRLRPFKTVSRFDKNGVAEMLSRSRTQPKGSLSRKVSAKALRSLGRTQARSARSVSKFLDRSRSIASKWKHV